MKIAPKTWQFLRSYTGKQYLLANFGYLERLERISIAPHEVDQVNYYSHNNVTDQ
jgi:hypothetical protein